MSELEVMRAEKEKQQFIDNFPKTKTFVTFKGETITRKIYSFEIDYPNSKTKELIFNHGKSDYTIWFLNAKKWLCVIDKAIADKNGNVFLGVTFDVNGRKTPTNMTLDRFLSLVEKGDFKITLKKFVDTYLKDAVESKYYKQRIEDFDKRIIKAKEL